MSPKLTPMVRFVTAPGIGKNYPIKFLIFIRGAMSINRWQLALGYYIHKNP